MNGQVRLPPLQPPPEPLRHLLSSAEPNAKKFCEDIWKYNHAFAFTSIGVEEDQTVNSGCRCGPPVFCICGELYHRSGAISILGETLPCQLRYAQIYIYEPLAALDACMANNADLNRIIMEGLQSMLTMHHQYVPIYRHAHEILQQYDPGDNAEIQLCLLPGKDHRCYNLPSANKVAAILPETPSTHPHDIILQLHNGPLQRISDLHPAYAPLQYPLLFPYGENGWYPEMMLLKPTEEDDSDSDMQDQTLHRTRRLTLTHYVAYRIHTCPHEFNALLQGGRLFSRYIVDMFAAADQQRLTWVVQNQPTFRAARFNNLQDAAADDDDNFDLNNLGQCDILLSSYTSGPCNMTQAYQDSMAIARYFRKVDIFLTMTTNPHWPEIQRELLPTETAYDCPDLVARVFQLKKRALIDYIYKHEIFGQAVAYVYTIEFQKCGLPHLHCLIFFKEPHKLLTPENIDSCICAEWPDPEMQPLLFETVKAHMVHGPYGTFSPFSPCMVDGKCSKNYPKDWQEFTTMDGNGYPLYQQRNDSRAYEVGGHMVDNRFIVPYSPFLCATFNCHINVKCASSVGSFKYLFKYIQKGPDHALLQLNFKDEVQRFKDG